MAEKKKKINSKDKGDDFERKTAKQLGDWWGEKFNRTPMSGGLHWQEDNRVSGDIVTPPDSLFPWVVECKKREEWDIIQLVKGTGEIEKWWNQVLLDSERTRMKPFLVFSKNFAPSYLMVYEEDFLKITNLIKIPYNYFIVSANDLPKRVVVLLDEFTKYSTKTDVIHALNL